MEIETISILSGCLLVIGFIGSVLIGEWVERRFRYNKWIKGFVIRSVLDESGIFVRLDGTVLKCTASKRINTKTCYEIFRECDDVQSIHIGEVNECFDLHLYNHCDMQNIHRLLLKMNTTLNTYEEPKIWTPIDSIT